MVAKAIRTPMKRLTILGMTEMHPSLVAGGPMAFLKYMKALALKGHAVTVATSRSEAGLIDITPARLVFMGHSSQLIPRRILLLCKLAVFLPKNIMRCNLVVANAGLFSTISLMLTKIMRRKSLIVVHNADSLAFALSANKSQNWGGTGQVAGSVGVAVSWLATRYFTRIADVVISNSPQTTYELKALRIGRPIYTIGCVVE